MNRRGMRVKSIKARAQLIRGNEIPGALLRHWKATMKRSLEQQFREKSALRQEVAPYLDSFPSPAGNTGDSSKQAARDLTALLNFTEKLAKRKVAAPAVPLVPSGVIYGQYVATVGSPYLSPDPFGESHSVSLSGRRNRADECFGCFEFSESQRRLC